MGPVPQTHPPCPRQHARWLFLRDIMGLYPREHKVGEGWQREGVPRWAPLRTAPAACSTTISEGCDSSWMRTGNPFAARTARAPSSASGKDPAGPSEQRNVRARRARHAASPLPRELSGLPSLPETPTSLRSLPQRAITPLLLSHPTPLPPSFLTPSKRGAAAPGRTRAENHAQAVRRMGNDDCLELHALASGWGSHPPRQHPPRATRHQQRM